jgi:hypothetical protein
LNFKVKNIGICNILEIPIICHIFSKYNSLKGSPSKMGDFLHTGEANQICAKAEAGALAGSNANTGGHGVEDGEHHRGKHGESGDLIHGERLLGDEDSGGGDH